MSLNGCTAAGYAAANSELEALMSRGHFRRNVEADGELSVESMATQTELLDREVSGVQNRINSLNDFLRKHTPQPLPAQFEMVELGHPVVIAYLNKQGKELEKKYVMAGAGEPEIYLGSGFMMLKSTCPFGELLMGKRVGDVFDAFLAGHNCEVRVKEILRSLVPDKFDDESAAPVTVTRLSIDGTGQHVPVAA